MQLDDVMGTLHEYVLMELLDGDGEDLDAKTPLLQWGVINSMEIVRIVTLLQDKYDLDITAKEATATAFRDIESIARWAVAQATVSEQTGGE